MVSVGANGNSTEESKVRNDSDSAPQDDNPSRARQARRIPDRWRIRVQAALRGSMCCIGIKVGASHTAPQQLCRASGEVQQDHRAQTCTLKQRVQLLMAGCNTIGSGSLQRLSACSAV